MNEKILLIQPPAKYIQPLLSLSYLIGYLNKNKITAELIDLQKLKDHSKENLKSTLKKIIDESKPTIIGLTAMTPQIEIIKDMAKMIKKLDKKVKIVVGGVHATVLPKDVLKSEYIDFVVIGEGEIVFLNLVKNIRKKDVEKTKGIGFKKGNKYVINERERRIEDLDGLPLPHHYYDVEFYANYFKKMFSYRNKFVCTFASRGCPFNCRFCAVRTVWGHKSVNRSPEKLVDEIEYIMKEYGIKNIKFEDSIFGVSRKWLVKTCNEIIKRKLKIKWVCNHRVDLLDYETLKLMKKAGLVLIAPGFESGSDKILDYYNKRTTAKQNQKMIENCHKLGIKLEANFLIGVPGETREDVEKTIGLVDELNDIDIGVWNIIKPFPGTPIYDEWKKAGYLKGVNWKEFIYEKSMPFQNKLFGEDMETILKELRTLKQKKIPVKKIFRIIFHLEAKEFIPSLKKFLQKLKKKQVSF